jgi:hypothetical protein
MKMKVEDYDAQLSISKDKLTSSPINCTPSNVLELTDLEYAHSISDLDVVKAMQNNYNLVQHHLYSEKKN